MVIQRLSNGKRVDLSKLSQKQLFRLSYEEERYTTKKALSLPPFSDERDIVLKDGYEIVGVISQASSPKKRKSYGAKDRSINLVCSYIEKYKKDIVLYEAGVGMGYSCRKFLSHENVIVRGCDIVLTKQFLELEKKYIGTNRLLVTEESLFKSLSSVDDESIDIFYADQVFEHLFPDEFPRIMKILRRKLKKGALLFLYIPNRVAGPFDDSRRYTKVGEPAQGFHVNEKSYHDMIREYRSMNMTQYSVPFFSIGKIMCVKDRFHLVHGFKLVAEDIMQVIPGKFLRHAIVRLFAMDCYIFIYNG